MLVVCSYCRKIRIIGEPQVMRTPDSGAIQRWAIPDDIDPSQPGAISHSICPDCIKKLYDQTGGGIRL